MTFPEHRERGGFEQTPDSHTWPALYLQYLLHSLCFQLCSCLWEYFSSGGTDVILWSGLLFQWIRSKRDITVFSHRLWFKWKVLFPKEQKSLCRKQFFSDKNTGTSLISIVALFTTVKRLEATQMSMDRWMDKQNVVETYNGILFSR